MQNQVRLSRAPDRSGGSAGIPKLLAAALLAGAAFVQPALAQGAPAPVRGGEMILALGSDLGTTNPVLSAQIPDVMMGCGIYEGLVQPTATFDLKPQLATSWTISPDELTYTFQLRRAQWSDGKPFTSEDVAFSILEMSAKHSPLFQGPGALIKSIDTPAPDRVVITLKQAFGPFLMTMSCLQGAAILPKHVFAGTDPRQNPASYDKPVGTGPMRLVSWKRGVSVELARNPSYWDLARPYLDRVVGRVMPQSTSRLQALLAGEIDFIQGWSVPQSDHATVRGAKGLKIVPTGYAPATVYMHFNTKKQYLSDAKVRHALAMATDREYILRTAWFNDGNVAISPFNSTIGWAVDPSIDFRKMYPFDIKAANKVLDDAGYKRGPDGIRFKVRITYPSDAPDRERVALALKSMWREIGVDAQPQSPERAVYMSAVYTQADFDVALEFSNTYGEPALGITRTYATSGIGRAFANASGYSNAEVDKLFAQGQLALDKAKRSEFYRKAQKIVAADLPSLPLREARMQDAATVKLRDLWGAMGPADWANAWLQK